MLKSIVEGKRNSLDSQMGYKQDATVEPEAQSSMMELLAKQMALKGMNDDDEPKQPKVTTPKAVKVPMAEQRQKKLMMDIAAGRETIKALEDGEVPYSAEVKTELNEQGQRFRAKFHNCQFYDLRFES